MEGLDTISARLEHLRHVAETLADTAASLNTLFGADADRLEREDGAQRLREIPLAIAGDLERLRRLEVGGKYEYTKMKVFFSAADFIGSIIFAAMTNNQQTPVVAGRVFNANIYERPYGNVMVRIGPEGLPEDVSVISISRLARESNRPELDIMADLRSQGSSLYTEESFSVLINKLVDAVLQGRLRLPISAGKLSDFLAPAGWRPALKKVE